MAGQLQSVLVGGGIAIASSVISVSLTSWLAARREWTALRKAKLESLATVTFDLRKMIVRWCEALETKKVFEGESKFFGTLVEVRAPLDQAEMLVLVHFDELQGHYRKVFAKMAALSAAHTKTLFAYEQF